MSARILSWNILHPDFATKSRYHWCETKALRWETRKASIEKIIQSYDPDIVCLQETLYLNAPSVPGFEWIYANTKRRMKHIEKGERPQLCAIGYLREKYSISGIERRSRSVSVKLRDVQTGTEMTVTSVHLPAFSDVDVSTHLSRDLGDIVMGDFNDEKGHPRVSYLETAKNYKSMYGPSCHPKSTCYLQTVIDHGFVRAPWALRNIFWYSPQGKIPTSRWPSDHACLIADVYHEQ